MSKSWRPADFPAPLSHLIERKPAIATGLMGKASELGSPLDWALAVIAVLTFLAIFFLIFVVEGAKVHQ